MTKDSNTTLANTVFRAQVICIPPCGVTVRVTTVVYNAQLVRVYSPLLAQVYPYRNIFLQPVSYLAMHLPSNLSGCRRHPGDQRSEP